MYGHPVIIKILKFILRDRVKETKKSCASKTVIKLCFLNRFQINFIKKRKSF